MRIKKPTYQEYLEYNGAHCHNLWAKLDDTWRCPACFRTKFEIMRWTTLYTKNHDGKQIPYKKGWMAVLSNHHDHLQGFCDYGRGRFPETLICGQCNSADGAAKRKLGLPKNFSFSPLEMTHFIISEPHTKHILKFEIARRLYKIVSNQMPLIYPGLL